MFTYKLTPLLLLSRPPSGKMIPGALLLNEIEEELLLW